MQKAGNLMTRRLITVGAEDSLRKAYQIMQDRRIRHLPVVDRTSEVIGLISDRDLQRAMRPASTEELFAGKEIEFNDRYRVIDFMSWPLVAVPEDTEVDQITTEMIEKKISAILVLDHHEQIKGIVTTEDLLKFLLRTLKGEPRKAMRLIDAVPHLVFDESYWESKSSLKQVAQ